MAIKVPDIVRSIIDNSSWKGMKAFLLNGPAGTGKTATTKKISDEISSDYIFIQCTPGLSETELIYNVLPDPNAKSGLKVLEGKLVEALKISRNKKVVLVLDEWDKTRPTADAFLLDYLQECRVSWKIESDALIVGDSNNLIVFLTSNAERDFSEPLMRRLVAIQFRYYKPFEMLDILKEDYGIGKGDCNHLHALVQLYDDTLSAGLNKPATIQELVQCDILLHNMGYRSSWKEIVYATILKSDDELELLNKFLSSANRKWIEFEKLGKEKIEAQDTDKKLVEAYEEPEPVALSLKKDEGIEIDKEKIEEKIEEESKKKVKLIPTFKRIESHIVPQSPISIETSTALRSISEYPTVVRTVGIEGASSKPSVVGQYIVTERGIESDKPISLIKLLSGQSEPFMPPFEIYISDELDSTISFIRRLINETDVIEFSNYRIVGENMNKNDNVKFRYEIMFDSNFNIKNIVKNKGALKFTMGCEIISDFDENKINKEIKFGIQYGEKLGTTLLPMVVETLSGESLKNFKDINISKSDDETTANNKIEEIIEFINTISKSDRIIFKINMTSNDYYGLLRLNKQDSSGDHAWLNEISLTLYSGIFEEKENIKNQMKEIKIKRNKIISSLGVNVK